MIKYFLKLLISPLVYLALFIRTMIKWLIIFPVIAALFFIKNTLIWTIVSVIAGIFLSPIATAIIIIIAIFVTFSKTKEDVGDFFGRFLVGGWDYIDKVRDEYAKYIANKKHQAYVRKALKDYERNADEFIGFDMISDIFYK